MDPAGRTTVRDRRLIGGWLAACIAVSFFSVPVAAQESADPEVVEETDALSPADEEDEPTERAAPADGPEQTPGTQIAPSTGPSAPNVDRGLSKIPYVRNLTEGFRIESTFTTFTVAPSNPQFVYVGTSNGLIYTSKDGGKTWVEHHLIKRVRDDEMVFRVRDALPTERRSYADAVNWPQVPGWAVYSLTPPGMMEPLKFRLDEILPKYSLALQDGVPFGGFDRIWKRSGLESGYRLMPPSLGHAPTVQERGRRARVKINWLSVHPEEPETVFAMTDDGMFRSDDGGYSWVREFDNPMADRRISYHVNFHPEDPSTRLLCTKHGLFKSTDGGETYSKVEDSILSRIGCSYVTFHPKRPDEIWVGTVFGVWVSENFGRTFGLRFYTRVPGQIRIKRVKFDPDNPDNILLASSEIVFMSRDGGESFERLGVYNFTKQKIRAVMFGREAGHLLVATDQDIWRSTDWGKNWESLMFGNVGWKIHYMMRPGGQKGALWVLSESELLEMSNRDPATLSDRQLERLMATIRDEPTMTETLVEALRANKAFRPERNRKRRKARLSHLLPTLHSFATYRDLGAVYGQGGVFYQPAGAGDSDGFGTAYSTDAGHQDWHLEVMGNWDLASLIFDPQGVPSGQNFTYTERLARSLRQSIQLVYAERRRLQIRRVVDPRDDPRAKLLREMRIEELTELLDIMTEGWFAKRVAKE